MTTHRHRNYFLFIGFYWMFLSKTSVSGALACQVLAQTQKSNRCDICDMKTSPKIISTTCTLVNGSKMADVEHREARDKGSHPGPPLELKVSYYYSKTDPEDDICLTPVLSIRWKAPNGTAHILTGFLLQVSFTKIDENIVIFRTFSLKNSLYLQDAREVVFLYECVVAFQLVDYSIRVYSLPRSADDTNSASASIAASQLHSCVDRSYCWQPIIVSRHVATNSSIVVKFTVAPDSFGFRRYKITLHGESNNPLVNYVDHAQAGIGISVFRVVTSGTYMPTVEPETVDKGMCRWGKNGNRDVCPQTRGNNVTVHEVDGTMQPSVPFEHTIVATWRTTAMLVVVIGAQLAIGLIVCSKCNLQKSFKSVHQRLLLLDSGDSGASHDRILEHFTLLLSHRCPYDISQLTSDTYWSNVKTHEMTSSESAKLQVGSFHVVIVVHTKSAGCRFDTWIRQTPPRAADVFCDILLELLSNNHTPNVYHICFQEPRKSSSNSTCGCMICDQPLVPQINCVYNLFDDIELLFHDIQHCSRRTTNITRLLNSGHRIYETRLVDNIRHELEMSNFPEGYSPPAFNGQRLTSFVPSDDDIVSTCASVLSLKIKKLNEIYDSDTCMPESE